MAILYLCDGMNKNCECLNCYKNNGPCRHTTDIKHAKFFHKGISFDGVSDDYIEEDFDNGCETS